MTQSYDWDFVWCQSFYDIIYGDVGRTTNKDALFVFE